MTEPAPFKYRRPKKKQALVWRRRMLRENDGACVFCLNSLTVARTTFDHVIPQSEGGSWAYSNLKPAWQHRTRFDGLRIVPTLEASPDR